MNVTSIGVCAGLGFILSFLTGLISGNAFLIVLLRAFIFSLIFAAASAAVSFVYKKFLADESVSFEKDAGSKTQKTAGNVDIVIQDEGLDDEDTGPKFYVENNRQGLSQENLSKTPAESPVPAAESVSVNFPQPEQVPVQQLSGAEDVSEEVSEAQTAFVPSNFASAEKVEPSAAVNSESKLDVPVNNGDTSNKVNNYSDGSNIEDIDSLPDIADLSAEKSSDSSESIISDSDFAINGSKSSGSSTTFPDGKEPSTANADVMAQAIRTLLANE